MAYLGGLVVIAVVAPFVLPEVMHEQAGDLLNAGQGPSADHLLGTDMLGRDVLNRLLVGTRVTMVGVAEAVGVALAIAVPLGLMAGYFVGRLDRAVGWATDLALSMPAIAIVLVVLSVFRENMLAAMVTLGILAAPALARIVRSAALPIREESYIAAARISGVSHARIIFRHILPRVAGAVIVLAALFAAAALLAQTGLAYLGVIAVAPEPSWGGLVGDGIASIIQQPWLIWPPGVAMALTVIAFGLLGDIIRDANVETWSSAVVRPHRSSSRPRRAAKTDTVGNAGGSLLCVDGLTVSFATPRGDVPVVEDVSFEIRPSETVGILGESGCGKSITAMSLLRLLPSGAEIVRGRITFAGRDLVAASERDLQRLRGSEVALIAQDPQVGLNPVFRVDTQLAYVVRRHHRVSRRAARSRVVELLGRVRLSDPHRVAGSYPHELSGGMAQRVAIARALAGEPALLIADEPTTALDVTVQAEILDLLRDVQRELGTAILLITHDWGVVADVCDRAIVMYAGQVVEEADLQPLYQQPRHPYSAALFAANPHFAEQGQALRSIPGTVPQPGDWPSGCHFHPRCAFAIDACRARPIRLVEPTLGRATRCIRHDELAAR